MKEKHRYEAVFQLPTDEYPERKRSTIIITDKGDEVHVAVTAIARVFEHNEEGHLTAHQEKWGDLRILSKDAPLGCVLDSLKELFDSVPETIDRTNNGDKA